MFECVLFVLARGSFSLFLLTFVTTVAKVFAISPKLTGHFQNGFVQTFPRNSESLATTVPHKLAEGCLKLLFFFTRCNSNRCSRFPVCFHPYARERMRNQFSSL